MRPVWKPVLVTAGALAVLAGTLLLMGNIQNVTRLANSTEFAKLQSTAVAWTAGLESARAVSREQVLRQGLLRISERPGEWTSWRAAEKYRLFLNDWNSTTGPPRAIGLVVDPALFHSFAGDTTGLAIALKLFDDANDADVAIFGGDAATPSFIAVQYRCQQDTATLAARWITIFDPATVLKINESTPQVWTLMSSPSQVLFTSASNSAAAHVSAATWPLIVGQQQGTLPGNNSDDWGFVRLDLPGMHPLLLFAQLTPPAAGSQASIWWIAAGVLMMIVIAVWPQAPNPLTADLVSNAPDQPTVNGESAIYRLIFQTVADPLCIVETDGRISRANPAAQDLLHVHRGRPDPNLNMEHGDMEIPVAAFLQQLATGAITAAGPVRLGKPDSVCFSGTIQASRVTTDEAGYGPLLVQFIHGAETATSPAVASDPADEESMPGADPDSPYAVLIVSRDGLIQSYNAAALAECPALENSPVLADVFPALNRDELEGLLRREQRTRFETIFGSATFEFDACPHNGTVGIYGHRAAATKQLEVALEQAHENFNTLCNMTPAAVLFLNVHDHSIQQCNVEACDLFGMTAPGIIARPLESLAAFDWVLTNEPDQEYFAATPDGRTIRCKFSCELIKIEGEPTMLVVLDPITTYQPLTAEESETQAILESVESPTPDEPALTPNGPGLLIVSNPIVRDVARKLLERTGHDVEAFTSLDDATVWVIAHGLQPELITLDVTDFDHADEWLADVRTRCGSVPCLAITDGEEYDLPNSGENCFLQKPFDLESIERALRELGVEVVAHA
jgi:PAS domain-containing protein